MRLYRRGLFGKQVHAADQGVEGQWVDAESSRCRRGKGGTVTDLFL